MAWAKVAWVILQLSSDEQDSEAAGEIEKMRITAQKKKCIFLQ